MATGIPRFIPKLDGFKKKLLSLDFFGDIKDATRFARRGLVEVRVPTLWRCARRVMRLGTSERTSSVSDIGGSS